MSLSTSYVIKTLGAIGALAGVSAVWWWWRRNVHHFKVVGTVSRLYLYPVKSCKGIPLEEVECLQTGVKSSGMRDREFLIVENNGHFITARQEPNMLLIEPSIHGDDLWLDGPNMETLKVTKPAYKNGVVRSGEKDSNRSTNQMAVKIWGEDMVALDCGDEASQWLSRYFGKPGLKLVYFPKKVSPRFFKDYKRWDLFRKGDNSIFADLTAYMLLSEASVDGLNSKLENAVTINNFRPSIAVEGCKEYEEECWKYVKIGSVSFRNVKPCTRCVLTTIDPVTAVKDGIEPLRTLKSYKQFQDPERRRVEGESPIFGVHLAADVFGRIKVGDPVYAAF